jgi:hypothetical protein
MRATAEEKKARTLQALRDARQAVLAAAAAVPPEATDTVFLGEWSSQDIIAHLIGWDYANMQAAQAILAGELPAFYAHHDHDWRSFNAELVRRYRLERYEATIQAAWESHQALYDLVATIPAEEFERDHGVRFRGYKVTITRLLAADSKDGQTHARQLRGFASQG